MKKMTHCYAFFIITIITAFLFCSCAAMQTSKESEKIEQLYIEATVQNVSDDEIVLTLHLPEFKKSADPFIGEIAQQVIRKGLFIEGLTTEIEGTPVVVKEVHGNIVKALLKKPMSYPVGSTVNLKIPQKTIAIVDFEVIQGKQKEAGRVTLEKLTSALIDSGHFNVVERAKLKTIIDELKLSMTGLMSKSSMDKVGQLQMADLILTGTLAEMRGEWDINLRLLNVRTGQAMAAITMQTKLFRPSEMRDSGPLNADFELDVVDPSWNTGYKRKGGFRVGLATTGGAEGSRHSLELQFNFKERSDRVFARAENRRKRDLYLYSGVEFYVKSTRLLTGQILIVTSSPDNPNIMDAWAGNFDTDTRWKKVRIPFDSLTIGRGWIKKGAEKYGAKYGDQILRLDRVEILSIGLPSLNNPPVKGRMWIDKIRFYQ
ncbi:MAG: FlgO family outer membrane protein [Syntrophales bacterium]|nr:FlgO family outer membrane protein [Syntrophales bacterium]